MKDKKSEVLAALSRGDFSVEYRLPENVEVREVEGEGTIYVIDPTLGCECPYDSGCDNGGCTVTVCGVEFDGFNGHFGNEFTEWQCDDEELTEDGELDEEIVEALEDHVTIFAEVGEDEVKELCAAYAGKTRDELASQFYLLGFDEIPGDDYGG